MTRVLLKELCQIKHGGTPSKGNSAYWSGSIPWISPKDMKVSLLEDASDHISEAAVAESSTSLVPTDTILVVARSGILAHTLPVARTARPLAFNQDIKALLPNHERVDSEYLYWFVRASEALVLSQGVKRGATVHSLVSGFLENLMVPLPSRQEQREIVGLLSRAEGIVHLQGEARRKASQIVPALFVDMFGSQPSERVAYRRLAEVCVRITDGAHKTPTYVTEGVPFLRVTDIQEQEIDWGAVKRIPLDEHRALTKRCKPERGDVLYSKNGTIGIAKEVTWNEEFSTFVSLALLKPQRESILPTYLTAYLSTPLALKQARDRTKTGTVQNLHLEEIREIRVPLPELAVQELFVERVAQVESIRRQQATAENVTDSAFRALLARAFSESDSSLLRSIA